MSEANEKGTIFDLNKKVASGRYMINPNTANNTTDLVYAELIQISSLYSIQIVYSDVKLIIRYGYDDNGIFGSHMSNWISIN